MSDFLYTFDVSKVKELRKLVLRIQRKGGDIRKPLMRWGAYMLQKTAETFDAGGRGPHRWQKLSPVTMTFRALRGRRANPRKILQDRGDLKRSYKAQMIKRFGGLGQLIFSRDPKASFHHTGGEMGIPSRTIYPVNARALHYFSKSGEEIFTSRVFQPARTVKIPARKQLFILQSDHREGVFLLEEHARELARAEGGRR